MPMTPLHFSHAHLRVNVMKLKITGSHFYDLSDNLKHGKGDCHAYVKFTLSIEQCGDNDIQYNASCMACAMLEWRGVGSKQKVH